MLFDYGRLVREGGTDPRGLTFAVLELETTGLNPNRGARVCEVAVVRMRGDGTVLDEYTTLVNPGARISNTEFHGITDTWVKGAPRFDQIAGDLLAFLDGAIVVGHKLDFEEGFLTAEFGRLGAVPTGLPGLCTLVAARTHLDRYGYRLDHLHDLVTGEWPTAARSALGDARSLARLLSEFVGTAPTPLNWAGTRPTALPRLPRSGIIAPRAAGLRKGGEGWLATLTARLPAMRDAPPPRRAGLDDYQAMLGHALADGRIVGEEAEQLAVLAARAGLTQETARGIHGEFLLRARDRAEADGVVTPAELKELQRAAKNLAASHLITDLEAAAATDRAKRARPLKGWRLLPVGDSAETTDLLDYAVDGGATVAVNLTKTVRLVVAPDGADDPRIAQAKGSGVPVLTPGEARRLLEGEAARADQRAADLIDGAPGSAVADRLTAERARERAAAPPQWHDFWRPRELTPAEYRARFADPGSGGTRRAAAPSHAVPVAATAGGSGGCASALLVFAAASAGLVGAVGGLAPW